MMEHIGSPSIGGYSRMDSSTSHLDEELPISPT